MQKIAKICGIIFIVAALSWGCAPKASYTTANSLGRASALAREEAQSTKTGAKNTDLSRNKMKKDIQSIKEAEKLFDEKSGIVLSY